MKILVTGGSGFVGAALCNRLVKDGHEVLATGNSVENTPEGVEFIPINLNGLEYFRLKNVDCVFHQAAINDTTLKNHDRMFNANVFGPRAMFYRLADLGTTKFIYASSCAVYGGAEAPYDDLSTVPNPLNEYGKSKLDFEGHAMNFQALLSGTVIGLRYSNIYGPGEDHKGRRMSMIRQIGSKIGSHKKLQLFEDGSQKRDWIYIDDVVEANISAMNYSPQENHVFNCGSGESTSFNDLVKILSEEWGWVYHTDDCFPVEYIENPIKDAYQDYTECKMDRIKEVLNFTPQYNIKQGIGAYVRQVFNPLEPFPA